MPGDDDLARRHRALSQAAVRCAQAAQAAVLAGTGPGTSQEAARRAAEQAMRLLASADTDRGRPPT